MSAPGRQRRSAWRRVISGLPRSADAIGVEPSFTIGQADQERQRDEYKGRQIELHWTSLRKAAFETYDE